MLSDGTFLKRGTSITLHENHMSSSELGWCTTPTDDTPNQTLQKIEQLYGAPRLLLFVRDMRV